MMLQYVNKPLYEVEVKGAQMRDTDAEQANRLYTENLQECLNVKPFALQNVPDSSLYMAKSRSGLLWQLTAKGKFLLKTDEKST
jgi:hypothetical protein